MTYDGINIGEAVQPIQDRVETYQSNGYAVVSPGDALSSGAYAVTVNSGNLDASDTLSVGSSSDEVLFDGSTKSLSSATNVRINSVSAAGDGTEQYRYDVIYADNNGEVQKTEGSVTKLDSRESQNNLTRFERFKAAIPNPGTDPSVIIAAVIVNSNDSSVGTNQLRDYRVPATTTADTVDANTFDATTTNTANLNGGVTGNTTVSDIAGSGINIVSGSLQAALGDGLDFASGNIQILDSIWDAANTELTADVNNTTTTTDTLDATALDGDTGQITTQPSGDDDILRHQEGVEVGTVTADGVDNSGGNNNWGQSERTNISVSFDNAFDSTPLVATAINSDNDAVNVNEYHHVVFGVSSTGFSVQFNQMSATDNSGTTDAYAVDYIASEGR